MNLFRKLLGHINQPARKPVSRRTCLRVESLEERQLLTTAMPYVAFDAPSLATAGLLDVPIDSVFVPLDMTAVASQFATPTAATNLFLNFDGWIEHIQLPNPVTGLSSSMTLVLNSPFASTTGNRDADIQEILYRTSEMFAPFNVNVRRMFGDGSYATSNGASTIFIGDDLSVVDAHGYTPASHTDAPIRWRAANHRPNSDSWNIARVDPVVNSNPANNWDNQRIAKVIAHEAGHTFGLLHVRTVGSDPSALDDTDTSLNPPEVMAYDSGSRYEYFLNQTYNLTIWNHDNAGNDDLENGLKAEWHGERIVRQNSYTYLQTVLGSRPTDDGANVAHRDYANTRAMVDAAYTDGVLTTVATGTNLTRVISRPGDYDVYQIAAVTTASPNLEVTVSPTTFSGVDPIILVFDDTDGRRVAFNNDSSGVSSRIVLQRTPGHAYKLVVGASNGSTTGTYRLNVINYFPTPQGTGRQTTSNTSTSMLANAPTFSTVFAAQSGSMGSNDDEPLSYDQASSSPSQNSVTQGTAAVSPPSAETKSRASATSTRSAPKKLTKGIDLAGIKLDAIAED